MNVRSEKLNREGGREKGFLSSSRLRALSCALSVGRATRFKSNVFESRSAAALSLSLAVVALALACVAPSNVAAQKRPKPAMREKDARRAIASMPGFDLKTSAVKVKEVSAAAPAPVRVVADLTLAVRFTKATDEGATRQSTGIFRDERWRAVEFRTGDREWESFDTVSAAAGDARVEDARGALERLVEEYEAHLKATGGEDGASDEDGAGEASKRDEAGEPFARGPLRLEAFSPLGSSAVAEIVFEATFTLARDAAGKWRVVEFSSGDGSSGDLNALLQRLNARKTEEARRDLEELRAALEAYRRERGFYVAAEDSTALVDHLNPRFLMRVIRIDPWHQPYRYEGSESRFVISSDGADGVANTADDIRLSGGVEASPSALRRSNAALSENRLDAF